MNTFHIYPAIDIRGGKCVRLERGDFGKEKVYADDPSEVAKRWEAQGAKRLHIVDLDGARSGKPVNLAVVEKVIKSIELPVQCGGGVKSREALEAYISVGARWVVLGTKAVEDISFLKESISAHPGMILASLDVRGEKASIRGWLENACTEVEELLGQWERAGLSRIIYTDISRDGTLQGFDMEKLKKIAEKTSMEIIASGGIVSLQDLIDLRSLRPYGVRGAIVGKALYDGRINLTEALELEENGGA